MTGRSTAAAIRRAASTISSRGACSPSSQPSERATAALVVASARQPGTAASATALATSHAFGRTRSGGSTCIRRNAAAFSCWSTSAPGGRHPWQFLLAQELRCCLGVLEVRRRERLRREGQRCDLRRRGNLARRVARLLDGARRSSGTRSQSSRSRTGSPTAPRSRATCTRSRPAVRLGRPLRAWPRPSPARTSRRLRPAARSSSPMRTSACSPCSSCCRPWPLPLDVVAAPQWWSQPRWSSCCPRLPRSTPSSCCRSPRPAIATASTSASEPALNLMSESSPLHRLLSTAVERPPRRS